MFTARLEPLFKMKRKLFSRNSNTYPERLGRRCLVLGWLALLLVCLVRPVCGLDPSRTMSEYVHQHWGTESGFPKCPVYSINQTADGYLWIGTDAGLVRFDGVKFELITGDKGAFKLSSVMGVSPDGDGSLWVQLPRPTLL